MHTDLIIAIFLLGGVLGALVTAAVFSLNTNKKVHCNGPVKYDLGERKWWQIWR